MLFGLFVDFHLNKDEICRKLISTALKHSDVSYTFDIEIIKEN